jgi:hypothetical protein
MNGQGKDDINKVKSPQKTSNLHLELANWMNRGRSTCWECWPGLIIEEHACVFLASAEKSNGLTIPAFARVCKIVVVI